MPVRSAAEGERSMIVAHLPRYPSSPCLDNMALMSICCKILGHTFGAINFVNVHVNIELKLYDIHYTITYIHKRDKAYL